MASAGMAIPAPPTSLHPLPANPHAGHKPPTPTPNASEGGCGGSESPVAPPGRASTRHASAGCRSRVRPIPVGRLLRLPPEGVFARDERATDCRKGDSVPKTVPFVPLPVPFTSLTHADRAVWCSVRVRDPCRACRFACRSCRPCRFFCRPGDGILRNGGILRIIRRCVSAVGYRLLATVSFAWSGCRPNRLVGVPAKPVGRGAD